MNYTDERIGNDRLININGRITHYIGWYSEHQVFFRKKVTEKILNQCPTLKMLNGNNRIETNE